MIRAVLFDLDGVLIDAVEWHYLALNRALTLFGYPIRSDEHTALYNGLPTSVKLELLSQRRGFPRSLHPFVNEMKQHYTKQIISTSCSPNVQTSAMLRHLKAQGYKLAVASNSVRSTVDLILDKLAIRDLFDVTLSNQDVKNPKPSPDIYLQCIELLGVETEECLIIEDALPGIQAARQVTPHVVIVKGPEEVSLERILQHIENFNGRDRVKEPNPSPSPKLIPGVLEIVVPMAGMGQRFSAAGFEKPKPFIEIFGKPMIQWVVDNIRPLQQEAHFTFLCNEKHIAEVESRRLLEESAPGCSIVSVPSVTQGAACTVCLAMDQLDLEEPLLIANSDQWVELNIDNFLFSATRSPCDGMILTFPATDKKWSYAKVDSEGRVVQVAEKNPISPHATAGIYYFKKGRYFFEAAKAMIRQEIRTNGEFYVCPVYNELISRGLDIRLYPIDPALMHGLGTPEDLELFIRWNLACAGRAAVSLGSFTHYV